MCVTAPVCFHVTPAWECEVTVCAQSATAYLVEKASERPDVRFEVVAIFT